MSLIFLNSEFLKISRPLLTLPMLQRHILTVWGRTMSLFDNIRIKIRPDYLLVFMKSTNQIYSNAVHDIAHDYPYAGEKNVREDDKQDANNILIPVLKMITRSPEEDMTIIPIDHQNCR